MKRHESELLEGNPFTELLGITPDELLRNHHGQQLPLRALGLLRVNGYYSLYRGGKLTLSARDIIDRTKWLGQLDPSLGLIDSMSLAGSLLAMGLWVSEGQRKFLAEVLNGKILAAFVSGRYSRSAEGPHTFATDVEARKVEGGFIIDGTKGFGTNAEGCDFALVTFKDTDDETPGGSYFGFVRMRDEAGNLMPRITIYQPHHTVGAASTRSAPVKFEGVFIPEEFVLPWQENALEFFLLVNALASFGAYTGAYLGALMRVVAFMQDVRREPLYAFELDACRKVVDTAWQVLVKAADLAVEGDPQATTWFIEAKHQTNTAAGEVMLTFARLVGAHNLSWNGPRGEMNVFDAAAKMANAQPPAATMIEAIKAGEMTLSM